MKILENITTGKGDDYITGCLLDYSHFKENYKLIAVDLSKQQALDADPRAIQQINFTANLDRDGNTTMFFIIGDKRNCFELFVKNCKSFVNVILWNNFIEYKV